MRTKNALLFGGATVLGIAIFTLSSYDMTEPGRLGAVNTAKVGQPQDRTGRKEQVPVTERSDGDSRSTVSPKDHKKPTPTSSCDPTPVQRSMMRRLSKIASNVGAELPAATRLSFAQWSALEQYFRDNVGAFDVLRSRQQFAVSAIAKDRVKAGQIEPTYDGPDFAQLPRKQMREVALSERPQFDGQLVSNYFVDGVRYVIRVNPGENRELDDVTSDLHIQAMLFVVGANQIIEAHSPK